MATIFTAKGVAIIVDDCDYEWLSQYSWRIRKKDGYALRRFKKNGKSYEVTMHSMIAEKYYGKRPDGYIVDHKNRDKLDNQSENLRYCTRKENSQNCNISKRNKSGFKCVNWNKEKELYGVTVSTYHIGYFTDAIAGANAYNYFAKALHGEFASVNDVEYMPREEWEKYCKWSNKDRWELILSSV